MGVSSGIQVRGDLCDLVFYQQHSKSPDDFNNFVAPYREVRDFDHANLVGGARLLQKFLFAELTLSGLSPNICSASDALSLPESTASGDHQQALPAGYLPFLSSRDGEGGTSINTTVVGGASKLACVEFGFGESGESFVIDWVETKIKVVARSGVELQLNCSESAAAHLRKCLGETTEFGFISITFQKDVILTQEYDAITPAERSEDDEYSIDILHDEDGREEQMRFAAEVLQQLSVPQDSVAIDMSNAELSVTSISQDHFDFNLSINGIELKSVAIAIVMDSHEVSLGSNVAKLAAKSINRVLSLLSRASNTEVVLSPYGDWVHDQKEGTRNNPVALWEIGEFGKHSLDQAEKRFRLKGPRGYLRNNHDRSILTNKDLPSSASTSPIDEGCAILGSVARECSNYFNESELDSRYEYLCFIDMGNDYAHAKNHNEWMEDLRLLQRAKYGQRLIVADIGHSLPQLRINNDDYRRLYECELLRSLGSPLGRLESSGDIAIIEPGVRNSVSKLLRLADVSGWRPDVVWVNDTCSLSWSDSEAQVACKVSGEIGRTEIVIRITFGANNEPLDFKENFTVNPHDEAVEGSKQEHSGAGKSPPEANYGLWDYLYCFFRASTMVIVSAHTLRAHGHPISHRLSWEKTAQDCIATLQFFPMKQLGEFAHLIIRTGITGAVHILKDTFESDNGRHLHFDPIGQLSDEHPDAFYRDKSELGQVLGSNAIFCGALVSCIIDFVEKLNLQEKRFQFGDYSLLRVFKEGIRNAILDCQVLYDWGYGGKEEADTGWIAAARKDCSDQLEYEPLDIISGLIKGRETLPVEGEENPSRKSKHYSKVTGITSIISNPRWRIIDESARAGLYRVACKVVVHGLDRALNAHDNRRYLGRLTCQGGSRFEGNPNWPKITAPVIRFGDFITTDRDEAECLRNIDYVLREYGRDTTSKKPLSLAVFGPPGAGKSFAVTEMMKSIFKNPWVETCNLSQLSDPMDLGNILLKFKDASSNQRVSVLFVDEFDSSLEARPLGWLRYFLALMQDGTFKHDKDLLHVDKCILVFAGGVFQQFMDFAGQSTASSDEKRLEFARAKGPDFVSRLSGHIDLIGINRQDEYDDGFVMRRALLLRSLIERRNLTGITGTSLLTPALIEAMLKVSQYNHGARSMEIVLRTCVGTGGKLWLPTLAQLRMHVDADQLLELYHSAQRDPTIFITEEYGIVVDAGHFS